MISGDLKEKPSFFNPCDGASGPVEINSMFHMREPWVPRPKRVISVERRLDMNPAALRQDFLKWWHSKTEPLRYPEDVKEPADHYELAQIHVDMWEKLKPQIPVEDSSRLLHVGPLDPETANAVEAATFSVINTSLDEQPDLGAMRLAFEVFMLMHPKLKHVGDQLPALSKPFGDATEYLLADIARTD